MRSHTASALGCCLVALFVSATTASAAMIDGRVNLGTNSANPIGEDFFDAGSGFVQGSTSHTNTVSFDDGVVQVDVTITAEAFDAGGAPAGLRVNNQAAGVEGGGNNDEIDPGESIKFTYDAITFSVIGALPAGEYFDPSSAGLSLSSLRFAAFDAGTDTYTFSGVGAANLTGDDTQEAAFVPRPLLAVGDMFTVTGDSGAFRMLYISHSASYSTIPEPSTLAIALLGLGGLIRRR